MKKRWLLLLVVFLVGCSARDPAMEAALELRSRCLAAKQVQFRAQISADYIDRIEFFSLECIHNADGTMSFRVLGPVDIEGIGGTVSGTEGTVEFDDTVLAFPLLAEGRLSPLSGPWVLMKAICTGNILAAGQEGELVHLTIDDSYADKALTVDLWLDGGMVCEAEIAWEGLRYLTMTVEEFSA